MCKYITALWPHIVKRRHDVVVLLGCNLFGGFWYTLQPVRLGRCRFFY